MTPPLRPIGDRVLVLPDPPDTDPDSLIVMPETVRDERVEMSGTVALIGPGPRCETCGAQVRSDLSVGDRVVFAPNQGGEVTYDGVRYIVLAQADILGIVED